MRGCLIKNQTFIFLNHPKKHVCGLQYVLFCFIYFSKVEIDDYSWSFRCLNIDSLIKISNK